MSQSLSQKFEQLRQAEQSAVVVPAVEDLDPLHAMPSGVVMIEPNPLNAAEVARTYSELQQRDDNEEVEEANDSVESLHQLKDLIDADNASGGLSAESACFAALATESLLAGLGISDDVQTASFESAISNPDGKSIVSTEAIVATLEAVDSRFAELGKQSLATYIRTADRAWMGMRSYRHSVQRIIDRAGKLRSKSVGKVVIKVEPNRIQEGAGASKDIPASLIKAAEILRFMVTSFTKQAAADYDANVKTLAALASNTENGKFVEADMDKLLQAWKDPRIKLGEKGTSPLIGNFVLFEDQSLKYKGDNATAKKFDVIANHAYPTVSGFQHHGRGEIGNAFTNLTSRASLEIPALSAEEIVRIGKALTQAMEGFGAWNALLVKLMSPAMPILGSVARTAGKRAAGKYRVGGSAELRAVRDALMTSNRLRILVGFDSGRVLRWIVGSVYLPLAKRSLKARAEALKASAEAMDQATATVGVSVNETAPNEPVQVVPVEDQAPPAEVVAHQPSFQDNPESRQDLNGNVQAATESLTPVPYWFRK